MIEKLIMAILSSLCPPVGVLGNIVEYIISDDPNAGKRFLLDIATINAPGGIVTDLAVDVIGDIIFDIGLPDAANQVTPYNEIILPFYKSRRIAILALLQFDRRRTDPEA